MNGETSERRGWALAFAAADWPIIRLKPSSKEPVLGRSWFLDMTTDAEIIRRWFEAEPDMNFGVVGGDNRVIIDLDRKVGRNGEEQWTALELALDETLPETLTVSTRTDGRHLYLTLPEGEDERGQSVRKIAKVLDMDHRDLAIDVRAGGGYCVGPGCTVTLEPGETGPGSYRVIAGNIETVAVVPNWLLPLLAPPAYRDPDFNVPMVPLDQPANIGLTLDFLERRDPAIAGHHGNDWTYETLAFVRDFGVSEGMVPLVIEASGWNARCRPPWSDGELSALIEHVYRYTQNRAGVKSCPVLRFYKSEQEPLDPRTFEMFVEERGEHRERSAAVSAIYRENPYLHVIDYVPEWFRPVAELNRRWAKIGAGPNVGRLVDLQDPSRPVVIAPERFRFLLKSEKVMKPTDKGPEPAPVAAIWEAWPGHRVIEDLEFRPPDAEPLTPGAHNLWRGFAVEPVPGLAHKPLLLHIRDNVCRGDADLYRWFVHWLADMVQHPGRKPSVAVALTGEPGAGKSVIYEYMAAIFGQHAKSVDSERMVLGNFNSHLASLILLGVEEGFWAGSKPSEGKLKHLVTGRTVMIEPKGVDAYQIDSYLRVLVTSNEPWVVPVGAGERRWAVLEVDPARKDDRDYWVPIWGALEDGTGPAHLLSYLLTRPVDPAVLYRPPATAAKAKQARESMDSIPSWWLAVLAGDREPGTTSAGAKPTEERPDGIFGTDTTKATVYADYVASCDRGRLGKAYASPVFWARFRELWPVHAREWKPLGQARMLALPDRETCRQAMAARYGTTWAALAA